MSVVALRQQHLPALPIVDEAARYRIAHAASFAGDPLVHLPDGIDDLAPHLPALIDEAERGLVPAGPAEVIRCLSAFAERRALQMPEDDLALDLDAEILGELPRDLFRQAIRRAWTDWPTHYRRLPDANFLVGCIREELDERRGRAARLRDLAAKLEYREKLRVKSEEMRTRSRASNPNRLERLAEAMRE